MALNGKDRPTAVFLYACFLCVASFSLAGCSASGSNPVGSTLAAFMPGHHDVSKQASQISYASIDVTYGHRNGLLILAEQTPDLTFWQTGKRETIALRDGYLTSTSGLPQDLRMSQIVGGAKQSDVPPWRQAVEQPLSYDVLRSWTASDGTIKTARANARLRCDQGVEKKRLPLTTLDLQRCVETLHWAQGATTSSVIWRNPDDHRIWAADTVAWPGAPELAWQVARPWW